MIYLLLFLLSFGLTYIIKNHAIKHSLFVKTNERTSHTFPTPQGGGIAIATSWFIGLTYLFFIDTINNTLYYALMIGIIISIVSYIDDIRELSPKVRLSTQAIVAILSLFVLGGFDKIDLYLFSIENKFLTNVFAFFIIIWFTNLYNFLDGIDGYAGSEAIFLSISGLILFGGEHFLVLIVSTLGFLFWNWHKAKIFMGDVGSTLLGYNISIFTIYYANMEPSNLWTWIILFGVFWFDATITLLRRYNNKETLSQAHKKHAYQRLHQSNWTHNKIVLLSILVNIVLFCFVYLISNTLIAFCISLAVLYTIMRYVDLKKGFEK